MEVEMKKLFSLIIFMGCAAVSFGFLTGSILPVNHTYGIAGLGATTLSLSYLIYALSGTRERYRKHSRKK